ncbi:alpha-mannosidase 2C1-like [Penaeus japonicus]|uniref:alpha-mannosidase 2C1-like n=1 Tax=Penaeus japonicus TaxID=27405 RepID=UPI001C7130A1|nr:alpha-mannosidase 2C1-like [Penaeus japonicus]XP_042883606.1 alpha-mannosidase 2C1-like [Penaeus japonicus]XP_042883607.1 alpha-mannosidase 2C1-like [Penaeus japonicus]
MSDPGVQASIHKNLKTTLPRIYNYIASTRFQDVNLVGRLYPDTRPVTLSHWALPGGEGAWQQWSFDQIVTQDFSPVTIGDSFGPTWTTHWFKLEFSVPDEWAGSEVRLRWGSNSEAAVWSADGRVLQGLSTGDAVSRRTDYPLTRNHQAGAPLSVYYVEMAANKLFGAGPGDQIDPPDPNMHFTLSRAEIAQLDSSVYKLTRDLEVLHQLAQELIPDPRGYQALYAANQMVNSIIAGDDSGASAIADEYFLKGNGQRAHTLAVIGNCHIDSAWLWPYSETKRKVARSFSSQLKLMEDYPEHLFVASQAQQWAWCKQYYPELFERIKEQVAAGKFLPVGGTWVEMDGNIPSGESFIRQFLHGQTFYQKELGITCREFWLPDTFGYSAQIPAMMRHMGLTRFLTQKMSWSLVNKFPHHNFTWEGIDGSTVLAHFPPGDSYSMFVTVEEALRTVNNLQDKGRAGVSAFLFGYGDGGGGPTQEMLERRRRLQDTDGCPKMEMKTPDDLFGQLETEQHNFCRWVGELYLELHNGTYTTQAAMKRLCREAEFRLRDAEFLLSVGVGQLGSAADQLLTESLAELDGAWKKVLLNQFHDVLPGSGIGIIYPQAEQYYQEAIESALSVWNKAGDAIFGTSSSAEQVVVNSLQWPRKEVVKLPAEYSGKAMPGVKQRTEAGEQYILVEAPPMGSNPIAASTPSRDVSITEVNGFFTLDNQVIKATVSPWGQVVSLLVAGDDRDIFLKADGTQLLGNQMVLYDDEPLYWDAWDVMDYHLETPKVLNAEGSGFEVTPVTVVESGPLVAKLIWSVKISADSTLTQEIELSSESPYLTFSTSVSWHENRKIMKALFDTNIHANKASFDIQFGHLERPTHMNTSWDTARYEVCGHKWADLSEPDWGMAVLNDSKYGWMARAHTLALSLLRSPKAPDDQADMKDHFFKYALMPHTGTLQEAQVVRRAYEFNNSLRLRDALPSSASWSALEVVGEGAVVHTVKATEDGSGDVLLRLYESHGSKTKVTLQVKLPVSTVKESDGMEAQGAELSITQEDDITSIPLSLSPFQILALRLSFSQTKKEN